MEKFSLSVVLPAFNEEQNIHQTVSDCIDYLSKNFNDYEILVIDDGSYDKTGEIVSRLTRQHSELRLVRHEKNLGYGAALNSGFEQSTKEYIFLMDSDGQFVINDLDLMVPLVSGNNLVLGYRISRADNSIRSLNAFLYNLYIRILFGLNIKDIDCAFKLIPKSAFDSVKPIKSRGALYSAELLIKIVKNSYEISEVGVKHLPRKLGEQSGANLCVAVQFPQTPVSCVVPSPTAG